MRILLSVFIIPYKILLVLEAKKEAVKASLNI